ncbi:MAG: hypothetical protein NTU48_09120 [Legionellales bacterium]|nr:hypothetical protein [Legionellales bacterium]
MANSREETALDLLVTLDDLLEGLDGIDTAPVHVIQSAKPYKLGTPKKEYFEDELDILLKASSDAASKPVEQRIRGTEAWSVASAASMFKPASANLNQASHQQESDITSVGAPILTSRPYASLPESSAIFSPKIGQQGCDGFHPLSELCLAPTQDHRPYTAFPSHRTAGQSKPPISPHFLKCGKQKASIFQTTASSSFESGSGTLFKYSK